MSLNSTIEKMARLLDEVVAELGDERRCIIALQAAGFSDREITGCLGAARRRARGQRANEIERRCFTMWEQ